jgi:hypothetical protein
VQTFFRSAAEPIAPPPTIPLLTMIRLNDAVLAELDDRGCTPLETTMLGHKLVMWPLFQKEMDSHVESVKRMADAAGSSGFGAMLRGAAPKDSAVKEVSRLGLDVEDDCLLLDLFRWLCRLPSATLTSSLA